VTSHLPAKRALISKDDPKYKHDSDAPCLYFGSSLLITATGYAGRWCDVTHDSVTL